MANTKNVRKLQLETLFCTLCKMARLTSAPNFWFEDLKLPKMFNDTYTIIYNSLMYFFYLQECVALFTQHNLTEKQSTDLKLFVFAHFIFDIYYQNLRYYKKDIRQVIKNLVVDFREIYNAEEIEKKAIAKSMLYLKTHTFCMCMTLIIYGVDGVVQILHNDEAFITIISAWPDVTSRTRAAGLFRVVMYLLWWMHIARSCLGMIFAIAISITLAHQYETLQSYFFGLNSIFDENMTQEEKEKKFEDSFKIGVKLHADTLRCTRQMESAFSLVYGGQILINITVLVLLMSQMVTSERTAANTATIAVTALSLLLNTGLVMWSAGDVTVQASRLHSAMFSSGWHHCTRSSSKRIRPLVVLAMALSQETVELKCFGVVAISYRSYVSIVKSSYSVFSVLY